MTDTRWRPIDDPIYQWVPTIDRILSAEPLPALAGPVVYAFSDYGGTDRTSSYHTIGILYMDLCGSAKWERLRRDVRHNLLSDGRRIAFKSLGDRIRKRALVPFLRAANELEGLCLVVAIRKSIVELCVNNDIANDFVTGLNLRRPWSRASLESLVRVSHLIAILVGGLARPGQSIYWISDEDALFANEATALDLREILRRFSSNYSRHITGGLGELGIGTSAMDPGDRFEEDNVAIPDLCVGAVAEILTQLARSAGGHLPPKLAIPFHGEFTPKTEVIYSWFTHNTATLRKVCVVFEALPGDGMAVFRFSALK